MTGGATGVGVGAIGVFPQLAARAPARSAMPSRAAWSVLVKPCRSLNFGSSDLKLYRKRRATSKAARPEACRFGHRPGRRLATRHLPYAINQNE